MPRIFTLGALVLRVRRITDSESGAPSDTEIKEWISSWYGQLHELFVATGFEYFRKEQTLTAQTTAAPSDYLGTLGIDYLSGNTYHALRRLQPTERNRYSGQSGGQAVAFELYGNDTGAPSITLWPAPSAGQSYRHRYIPQPADLSAAADATNVDVIMPAAEQLLVYGAASDLMAKEESDPTYYERKVEQARARIEAMAHNRDMAQSQRIIDINEERIYRSGDWLGEEWE